MGKNKEKINSIDDINYYIWIGDDTDFNIYENVKFPNGSFVREMIGQVKIKSGDAIYLDFGMNKYVSTKSGMSFEPEFKHGKAIVYGVGAFLILTEESCKNIKTEKSAKLDFNNLVNLQKSRLQIEIEDLKDVFIYNQLKIKKDNQDKKIIAEELRRNILNTALNKMEAFFSEENSKNKKTKP